MHVTLVVSRFFDNTREFARAVAREAGVPVNLLPGDAALIHGARQIRSSQRVWFEGIGPLLEALVKSPPHWKLPGACLRVGADEIARLPLPDLWRVVTDLVVPTPAAVRALLAVTVEQTRAAPGSPPPGRVHAAGSDLRRQIFGEVVPGEEITTLVGLLMKPPGDLPRKIWTSIATVAEACRGRVLVRGDAPPELFDHLTHACGLEVAADDPADMRPVDSIVFWQNLTAQGGAGELEKALPRLRPGGAVVTVAPSGQASKSHSVAAVQRVIAATAVPAAGAATETSRTPPSPVTLSRPEGPCEGSRRGCCLSTGQQQQPQPANGGLREGRNDNVLEVPGNSRSPAVQVRPAGPLVSAVVPVYNEAVRVRHAIASLQSQTYPHLEIVVVDDGSTDGTAAAVGQHLNDPRVRYFYKEHSGRPETRNLGVRQSRGEFVAWLGADDESMPCRIERQVAAALATPGADIVHTDGLIVRPDGSLHERRHYPAFTAEEFPRRLLAGFAGVCPILDTSAMIRRSVYDRVGLYDTTFVRCQDYDFYLRTAMAGDVTYAHVPLALVKVHLSVPSADKRRMSHDFYSTLALKLIQFFGPDRLMDPVARDLQLPPYLVLAEYLTAIVAALKMPPGSALCDEAQRYLGPIIRNAGPMDRGEACKLLGAVSHAGGDEGMAELFFAKARNFTDVALGRPPAPAEPCRPRPDVRAAV